MKHTTAMAFSFGLLKTPIILTCLKFIDKKLVTPFAQGHNKDQVSYKCRGYNFHNIT